MNRFFDPQSVAIIGVSDTPGNLGEVVVRNLKAFGYQGRIYCVGHVPGTVRGLLIYPSVEDIEGTPDLAVVLVKSKDVPRIAEQCGQKGIRRLVISSAGFSEYRPENRCLEDALLDVCRTHHIRFIGPNCLAIVNAATGLFLPFSPQIKNLWRTGPVSIIAQSGTIGMVAANHICHANVGVSKLATVGNKLDVDEADLLAYFLADPQTKIIFLYLEGFCRARAFFALARQSDKPIVVLKSNIASQSNAIAGSHTTAMASDDAVVDAAFQQAGIIRAASLQEAIDCIKVLLLPPLNGNRLMCLSESGGPAVIAADEADRNGFVLPPLPRDFLNWVKDKGRAKVIAPTNPLDMGDIYYNENACAEAFDRILHFPHIDGVYYDLVYSAGWEQLFHSDTKKFEHRSQISRKADFPVYVNVTIDDPDSIHDFRQRFTQPFFQTAHGAFKAMRKVMDSRRNKIPFAGEAHMDEAVREQISAILADCRAHGKSFLDREGFHIMEALGVCVATHRYVPREEAKGTDFSGLGYPVALKATGEDLVHKTEVGAVCLDIENPGALGRAFDAMLAEESLKTADGFLIQPMVSGGIEMIIGAKRDPQFGPIVMVGMGGVMVEIWADTQMALAPIGEDEAMRRIRALRSFALLQSFRGEAPSDMDAVAFILKRISDLMVCFPEVQELDLNPVKVFGQGAGAKVVDCKIFTQRGANGPKRNES